MKKVSLFLASILMVCVLAACGGGNDSIPAHIETTMPQEVAAQTEVQTEAAVEETTIAQTETSIESVTIEYDELQKLYLALELDMSYDEIMEAIKKSELPAKDFGFDNMMQGQLISVAFDEKVLPDKRNEPGDKIEISLKKRENELIVACITYSNYHKFIEAINNNSALNLESGLYLNTHVTVKGKIDYITVNSKEEQVKYIANAPDYMDR